MKKILYLTSILIFIVSCNEGDIVEAPISKNTHIQYFGFTLIDTYWDDPSDSEVKLNYADEVFNFSNLSDILVLSPNDILVERIQNFNDLNMKAVLHMTEIFFEVIDTNSNSGTNYDLRIDYEQRWNEFVSNNETILDAEKIGSFFVGEEPTWNGISFDELNLASTLIKNDFPEIPIMLIEAYPSLNELQIPETIDWVGFDHYFIKDPNTSIIFQDEWQTLKSKLSNPSQKLMVIMDTHYIDWAHGDFGNIELDEMLDVSNNYYELAKNDTMVIGILGYFWPNGFDIDGSIGARGMPEEVKLNYIQIGKEITGKK